MSSQHKAPATTFAAGQTKDLHIGIVTADWNPTITQALLAGATHTLLDAGVPADHIHHLAVPGAFELPLGARLLIGAHPVDAVVCLGCVVKGDTRHDEYINQSVATGLTQLSLTTGKLCAFGVLTTDNMQQALDRAGGSHGNKGQEAAEAALAMAIARKNLAHTKGSIGFA
jgi:6,7-dimethyl-8-ribityllumazine synthase